MPQISDLELKMTTVDEFSTGNYSRTETSKKIILMYVPTWENIFHWTFHLNVHSHQFRQKILQNINYQTFFLSCLIFFRVEILIYDSLSTQCVSPEPFGITPKLFLWYKKTENNNKKNIHNKMTLSRFFPYINIFFIIKNSTFEWK